MNVFKENTYHSFDKSAKGTLSGTKSASRNAKKTILWDVGNTLHTKNSTDLKSPKVDNVTGKRPAFKVLQSSNNVRSSHVRTPMVQSKKTAKSKTIKKELVFDDENGFDHKSCEKYLEGLAVCDPLPAELKLTREDVSSLRRAWVPSKRVPHSVSFSPIKFEDDFIVPDHSELYPDLGVFVPDTGFLDIGF